MIRVAWVIEWAGVGSALCADTGEATDALVRAVRAATADHGAEVTGQVLYGSVGPLRTALATDGRAAVERGEEWSGSAGGISVTLSCE